MAAVGLRRRVLLPLGLLVLLAVASSITTTAAKRTIILTEDDRSSSATTTRDERHARDAAPHPAAPTAIGDSSGATLRLQLQAAVEETVAMRHDASLSQASLYKHLSNSNPLIADRAQSQLNCSICTTLVTALEPALFKNATEAVLIDVATFACEVIKPLCHTSDACAQVCNGVVAEFRSQFFELMHELVTPTAVCAVLKQCPAPPTPTPPTDIPVRSDLSNTDGETVWPSWDLKTGVGTFVHLSDVHIDPTYTVGGNAGCGLPICCHTTDGTPSGANDTAGYWGDYRCDAPLQLVNDLLDFLGAMDPQPDFIVYTGDDPAHDVWKQSREENLAAISLWNSLLDDRLTGRFSIPVFSTLGNHEVFPINQFAGPGLDSWLYDAVADAWSPNLPDDAINTMQYGGYYQARVRPGLRVISINSNYLTRDNFWLLANETYAYEQLNWAADVLSQCESRNEKVVIICHHSIILWQESLADAFLAIAEQYQSTIVNYLMGHTHCNQYTALHTAAGAPMDVSFVGGSVVPYTNLNPGFMLYEYDREAVASGANYTSLIQQARGYWADLDDANESNATDWKVYYDMAADLGVSGLDAASLAPISPQYRTNNTLYTTYITAYSKGVVSSPDSPQNVACATSSNTQAEFHTCMHASGVEEAQIQEERARADGNC